MLRFLVYYVTPHSPSSTAAVTSRSCAAGFRGSVRSDAMLLKCSTTVVQGDLGVGLLLWARETPRARVQRLRHFLNSRASDDP